MSRRTLTWVLLMPLLVGGCRGNGGGESPTAPPAPPPPPPAPPALAVVEGSLVGLFTASSGLPQFSTDFSGSKVEVERVDDIGFLSPRPTGEVSAANTFRIEDVPVGNAWVTVSGPNHLTREMRWAIRAGTNTFEGIDLVNDPDFPTHPFWKMFQWSTGGIGRWVEPAHIVVVSPNIDYDDVVTAMLELASMTRSRFVASVEARPPTAAEREALDLHCHYTGTAANGKIFVGQGQIDEARICIDRDSGIQATVAWALVRIRDDPQAIRHAIGHGAGAWHPCADFGPTVESLMNGKCTSNSVPPAPDWTVFDRQAFLFAYSRPPGTLPDDFTRHIELMQGTVSGTDGAGDGSSAPVPGSTLPGEAERPGRGEAESRER